MENANWNVIIRKNGAEEISEPMSYFDAVQQYEKKAAKINAVNVHGEYLHPETRISLRKSS